MTLDKLWSGSFGDDYTRRNLPAFSSSLRATFWKRFYDTYPVKSVLEIGCGAGANLRWAEAERIYGMDVNESALAIAETLPNVVVVRQSLFDRGLADGFAELVFACGVLIHVEPARIHEAMGELIRLSSKYVLVMEYEAKREEAVPYRGQEAALWRRPYRRWMSERIGRRPLRGGLLTAKDGFDNVMWSVWEK